MVKKAPKNGEKGPKSDKKFSGRVRAGSNLLFSGPGRVRATAKSPGPVRAGVDHRPLLATSLPVARLGLGEPSSSNARAGAKAASSWLWLDEPSAPYGGAGGPAEARVMEPPSVSPTWRAGRWHARRTRRRSWWACTGHSDATSPLRKFFFFQFQK